MAPGVLALPASSDSELNETIGSEDLGLESSTDNADPGALAAAKLTALWALSEGGLGGILHATRLPLRGVILACIAVVSICLISRVSRNRTAALRAAVVVLAIKAVLAPHSVGGAYIAVLNQAIIGTVCMAVFGPSLFGCMLVGALNLIETSLHHLFWATLLGGMNFWASLNRILMRFQVWLTGQAVVEDPAQWVVVFYVAVHLLSGLAAGFIAWRLPRVAQQILASQPKAPLIEAEPDDGSTDDRSRRKKRRRWVKTGRGMLFILVVIAMAGPGLAAEGYGPWYWRVSFAALRLICVVAVFLFVVRPLVMYVLEKVLRRGRRHSHFDDTLAAVHALQDETAMIWRRASGMRLWRRLPHCVAVLFATALVGEKQADAVE